MIALPEWVPPAVVGGTFTALGLLKVYGMRKGIAGGGGKPVTCRLLGSCPSWGRRLNVAFTILLLAIGLGCLLFALMVKADDWNLAGNLELEETARLKSPDLAVEAVLLTGSGGATTATGSYLYIVPAGGRVDWRKHPLRSACFVADHVTNLKVVWKAPRLVEIQYDEARIWRFSNFWSAREVQDFRYVVEVRLSPSSSEFALPVEDWHWQ